MKKYIRCSSDNRDLNSPLKMKILQEMLVLTEAKRYLQKNGMSEDALDIIESGSMTFYNGSKVDVIDGRDYILLQYGDVCLNIDEDGETYEFNPLHAFGAEVIYEDSFSDFVSRLAEFDDEQLEAEYHRWE